MRILAVTGDRRFPGLPDVPTVAESGVPGYAASSWNAIAAPARTPPAVIARLAREINAALTAPEVREKLAQQGVQVRGSTPQAMRTLVAVGTVSD